MKHLYIIGNGFDLHHNMITNYCDFCDWLKENDSSVLCTIEELFGECDSEWWKLFEANLASAITSDIIQEEISDNYPNFEDDGFRDLVWTDIECAVQDRLEDAYKEIRKAFHSWIGQLKGGNPARKIRIYTDDAFFISFNYSHTLEDLYGVPENHILYIHGKAGTEDELVLGHGESKESIKQRLDNELPMGEEGIFDPDARWAAAKAVYTQRKPVDDIILAHKDFFNSLSDVEYLHFYGHSLGEVDLKYFRKILSVVNKNAVKIEFNDYNGENKVSITNFMRSEGFKESDYSIISLDDLLLSHN